MFFFFFFFSFTHSITCFISIAISRISTRRSASFVKLEFFVQISIISFSMAFYYHSLTNTQTLLIQSAYSQRFKTAQSDGTPHVATQFLVPIQFPIALHLSPTVQEFPSSQDAVLAKHKRNFKFFFFFLFLS